MPITLLALTRGTYSVLPSSFNADVQSQLSMTNLAIVNLDEIRTKQFNSLIRSSQRTENYSARIWFTALPTPVNTHVPSIAGDTCLVRCSCFTGDTLIALAEGISVPISSLVGRDYFYVYSYDVVNRKVVIGKGHSARRTGQKRIVRIVLDNGTEVRCTPDHKFLLKTGEYKEAKDLNPEDSLMAAYRKRNLKSFLAHKYKMIAAPGMAFRMEHYLADDYNLRAGKYDLSRGQIRHHFDFNADNNSPDNIQRVTKEEHDFIHVEQTSARMKANNPMSRKDVARKVHDTQRSLKVGIYSDNFKPTMDGFKRCWADPEWRRSKSVLLSGIVSDLAKDGNHPAQVSVQEGTHYFQTEAHSESARNRLKKLAELGLHPMHNPENVEKSSRRVREFNLNRVANGTHPWQTEEHRRRASDLAKEQFRTGKHPTQQPDWKERCRERAPKVAKTRRVNTLIRHGFTCDSITQEDFDRYSCLKYFSSLEELKLAMAAYNHKILSIEDGGVEDVYDFTVDEYHNYLIDVDNGIDCSSGIFVHNCDAYYYFSIASNAQIGGQIGGWMFKRYIRKTPPPPVGRPYANPALIPTLCKHLVFLVNILRERDLIR